MAEKEVNLHIYFDLAIQAKQIKESSEKINN